MKTIEQKVKRKKKKTHNKIFVGHHYTQTHINTNIK